VPLSLIASEMIKLNRQEKEERQRMKNRKEQVVIMINGELKDTV
jgi:hypothetical protein